MKSLLSRFKIASAFLSVVRDPTKTDKLFQIADESRKQRTDLVESSFAYLFAQPGFQSLFAERFSPPLLNVEALLKYEESTLGRAFAEHMKRENLRVDFYPKREGDEREVYLIDRIDRSHDVWHVLTGFGTNVPDELGLQAFTLAQLRSPFSLLILAGGILHTLSRAPQTFGDVVEKIFGGYQMGLKAKPLIGWKFENDLARPLFDVQKELQISPLVKTRSRAFEIETENTAVF